jgi:hypothetical protein
MLVMYTHRANIKRLIEGTENRFAKLHLIRLKHKESKQSTKKPESE